jgi:hypothetical protein
LYLGILPTVRYFFIYIIVTDMGGQYHDIQTQILVFGSIKTIVTDMEAKIRIDRLLLGYGTDQWT